MAVIIDGNLGVTSPDFEPSSSTTPTNGLFLPTTNALGFATNSAERLRLDASGNLGLGVTPSAWSLGKALDLGGGASILGYANYTYLSSNAYYNSGWKYIGSGNATYYQQNSGIHAWNTAPSGTAGNAISFTQAMTLDASGNLGIGTTSPGFKFEAAVALGGSIAVRPTTAAANALQTSLRLYGHEAVVTSRYVEIGCYNGGGSDVNSLTFSTGYGTTVAERARIDSSGNLLVGTTSALGRLASQQTTSAVNFRAECNVASYTSTNIWSTFTSSGNNNTTAIHFAAYTGTNVCVIYGNGNIQNTNNSYGALSDIKLKENIVDATPKLEDLCKVKIRNFSLKGEQNHKQIGVVAQELEEIFPGLVEEVADRDKEGNILGTSTKSVKYSVFTPMLIKAIQELTARLEALEAK